MVKKKVKKLLFQNWQIILILVLALFLRVFRLPYLITFAGDQGRDLLVVQKMIVDHRWTLLGPKTSIFPIYFGPAYYYLILPVLFVSKLDPLGVSYFMVFLWLCAIYLTYLIGKNVFCSRVGLYSAFFFSIWPLGIEYSRQSFSSFPTPFFATIFLFGLWYSLMKKNNIGFFLTGLSFGVMMQLHYLNFLLFLTAFFVLVVFKKLSLKRTLFFLFGFIFTFSPMIMFEVRHNLFNSKTLIFSLKDKGMGDFKFSIYYFVSFFPVIFILLGWFINFIYEKKKIFGVMFFILLTILNIRKIDFWRDHGFTMPEGWNYLGVKKASEIIANDASGNFNVAAILDGDTRAYPYRYIIETKGKKPMTVEDYPKAEILYVVARGDEEFVLNYPVWEIQSFMPASIKKTWKITDNISVYKLGKIKK